MGKIKVLTLVLTKLDIELGLAQPQLVIHMDYIIVSHIRKLLHHTKFQSILMKND